MLQSEARPPIPNERLIGGWDGRCGLTERLSKLSLFTCPVHIMPAPRKAKVSIPHAQSQLTTGCQPLCGRRPPARRARIQRGQRLHRGENDFIILEDEELKHRGRPRHHDTLDTIVRSTRIPLKFWLDPPIMCSPDDRLPGGLLMIREAMVAEDMVGFRARSAHDAERAVLRAREGKVSRWTLLWGRG